MNTRLHGSLELILKQRADGTTGPSRLYQAAPLRLLMPDPAPDEPFQGAVTCVSGGVLAGDRLDVHVRLEPNTQALLIGQAGEKIYRSEGADSVINNHLVVEDGAALEWLPQETILFDSARLKRQTHVRLANSARFMGGEIVVFGRVGSGEAYSSGLLQDDWRIFDADQRLIWRECLQLDGDVRARIDHPAGLGGARAVGMILCQWHDFPLARLRDFLETASSCENCLAAAGRVGNLHLIRLLSPEPACLRQAFGDIWCLLRAEGLGRPASMPILWHI